MNSKFSSLICLSPPEEDVLRSDTIEIKLRSVVSSNVIQEGTEDVFHFFIGWRIKEEEQDYVSYGMKIQMVRFPLSLILLSQAD